MPGFDTVYSGRGSLVGINDGMDKSGGIYLFSTMNRKIHINGATLPSGIPSILANDTAADGFDSLTIVHGIGSVNTTSGNSLTEVYYNAGTGESDYILLSYRPHNSVSGLNGNITYIIAYIPYVDSTCSSGPCELVVNGNFDGPHTGCGQFPPSDGHLGTSSICAWTPFISDGDLYVNGCTDTIDNIWGWIASSPFIGDGSEIVYDAYGDSSNWLGLWGGYYTTCPGGYWQTESVESELSSPLVYGNKYILSFDGRVAANIPGGTSYPFLYDTIPVQFFVSADYLPRTYFCSVDSYGTAIAPLSVIDSVNHPLGFRVPASIPHQWHHFTDTFTYYGPTLGASTAQFIQVMNASYYKTSPVGTPPDSFYVDYVFLDNISIKPIFSISVSATPSAICAGSTVCLGVTITNPTTFVPYDYLWIGPAFPTGINNMSDSSNFPCTAISPFITADNGVYEIVVTDNIGCQDTAYDTLNISVLPLPIAGTIVGPDSVCPGSTITLSDSGSLGSYWWSSNDTSIGTIDSTGLVVGITGGVVVITYSDSNSCGHVYTTDSITVIPLPSASLTISPLTNFCQGDSTFINWSAYNFTSCTLTISDTSIAYIDTVILSSGYSGVSGLGYLHTRITGSGGPVTITLKVYNQCDTIITIDTFTILTAPNPGIITGNNIICLGVADTLIDSSASGYTFSEFTLYTGSGTLTTISTTPPTAVYNDSIAGLSIITFLAYNATCGYRLISDTIIVDSFPNGGKIGGSGSLCVGSIDTFYDTRGTGGTWWVSDTSIAIIGSTSGILTGIAPGVTTIYYSMTFPCGSAIDSATIYVNGPPTLSITNDTVLCYGAIPINLWVDSVLNPTRGFSYSWAPTTGLSCANCPNPNATPIVGTTYYVTVFDSTTGCSNTTSTMILPITCGCSELGGPSLIATGGSIGTTGSTYTVPPGKYYLANNLTIYGKVIMTDVVLVIAANVTINIDPAAELSLNGSHFFSCSMWDGIVLQSNHSETGVITLEADAHNISTLIEDARKAIYVNNPVKPNTLSPAYIISNSAIYNKCYTGIYISNYAPVTPVNYQFNIQNSVFTCRDFSSYTVGSGSFPDFWPSTEGVYGLKTSWPAPAYVSPYNISNPTGDPSGSIGYPGTTCNVNPWLTPLIGIELQYVGAPDTNSYPGITIGAPYTSVYGGTNVQQNLFDTLNYGVYAIFSNFTVHNSVFAHMSRAPYTTGTGPATGGVGVYGATLGSHRYAMAVEPVNYVAHVLGSTHVITSTNYFYNCKYGVSGNYYYHIKGEGAYMITTQQLQNSFSGYYGYDMTSLTYDSVWLNNNTIINVCNGISFTSERGLTGVHRVPVEGLGNLQACNNTINAAIGGAAPTTQYVSYGIALQDIVSPIVGGDTALHVNGVVTANNNTMSYVFRGMLIQNYWMQDAETNNNTISVTYDPFNPESYGIAHFYCAFDTIQFNTVTGVGHNPRADSLRGFLVKSSSKATVSCNTADNVGRGFEFMLNDIGTSWHDNIMDSNYRGMVLNGGLIGTQGAVHDPTDNNWTPATGWYVYLRNEGTFLYNGSVNTANTLYVQSIPPNNQSLFVTPYNTTDGSLKITSPGSSIPCGPKIVHNPFDKVAQNDVSYPVLFNSNSWAGQHHAWKSAMLYAPLTDSSDVVASFANMAANSRMAWLTNIENSLATGDIATANSLIASPVLPLSGSGMDTDAVTGAVVKDDATVDFVINNAASFYSSYANFAASSMISFDTANIIAIAYECPELYGPVVFQARSLYSAMNHTLMVWNDDSCLNVDTGYVADRKITNTTGGNSISETKYEQQYFLFPNPNDGNITLEQLVPDELPVSITITNVIGDKIYDRSIVFNANATQIQLQNISPGMYLLNLLDGNGRIFTFKFAVE